MRFIPLRLSGSFWGVNVAERWRTPASTSSLPITVANLPKRDLVLPDHPMPHSHRTVFELREKSRAKSMQR
jgi:hypothetical protein